MSSDRKVYGFQQVAKHNQKDDCWLIISEKVYDITSFLDDHPGGDDVLLQATGKDATEDFEDVGHSKSAREMLTKYYVGEIDVSTIPVKGKGSTTKQAQGTNEATQSSGFVIKLLQFLLPLVMLGLAIALNNYKKQEKEP